MVDAIVSFAVERLGDFLIQQAKFLQGVRHEVAGLKDELEMMKSFLKDAAEKQDGDNRVREWISQIRDVAYDIEDVIDTFILNVEGTPKRGFLVSVKKCSCICNKEIDLYNIGKNIEALKARVIQISRRREAYGIRNIGEIGEGASDAIVELIQLRRTASYADEEKVVGFEDITSLLVRELLKTEPQRCMISILGMGGLGKTTLARKLYHHAKVEGRFEHHAWVCVSQEYEIRDLLQRFIKSFKQVSKEELEMLEKMSEEDLEKHLREMLNGRRYIVVIDDVWKENAWKILRKAFPENNNGSRVILTTRNKVVAECPNERTYVHKLRFLRPDESWELFCKKAFPFHNATDDIGRCPSDLETLGKEMVAKCDGLPLAVIVLGGLFSKKQPHEWQILKEHIWRDLRNHSNFLSQILALSFNDLPYQLKPCFLYLGLFPEDSIIHEKKLIRLWVAEGFVPPRDQETLEEVAEDWLNELIDRSLIQNADKGIWWRTEHCAVHDLLRDLAINKAKEINFLHIYDKNMNSAPSSSTSNRRQAAHCSMERYVSVDYSNSCLRTLMIFDQEGSEPSSLHELKFIFTRFRLLRVLDLEGIKFNSSSKCNFPVALGELIHLRYLGLRDTKIEVLPPSLVNLHALQTLDAFSWLMNTVRLPSDISKLKQLRHLVGRFEEVAGIEQLKNLQTLKYVVLYGWIKINPVNLINLRELDLRAGRRKDSAGIRSNEQSREEEFSLDSIAYLTNLQSLRVELQAGMFIASMQPLSHCQHLFDLQITGRIKIPLPDEQLHEYLPHLKRLSLRNSGLREDPMPTLGKLPNLMILELYFIRDLQKLICTGKGFPRLQVLELDNLDRLEEFEVGEGAVPMLKDFKMERCKKEVKVPESLKSILVTKYPIE